MTDGEAAIYGLLVAGATGRTLALIVGWWEDRRRAAERERTRQIMPPARSSFYPWNRKRGCGEARRR